MMKKTAALLFLVSISFLCQAQLRFGRISTDKGLSQATVYCSYQDSEGFLWFGTEDGLNKYDGYTFEIYKSNPSDTTTISNNVVRCMFEDSKQNLWIGTDNGLNVYKRSNGSFIRYINNPGDTTSLSNNFIYSICEDKSGTIWVGTSSGLNAFNSATGKFSVYKNELNKTFILSSNFISSLLCDNNGMLWVGTFNNGVNVFDTKTKQVNTYVHNAADENSLSGNEITSIIQDKEGTIWIGTLNNGLNSFNPSSKKFTRFKADETNSEVGNSVFTLCEDNNGRIWIGTSNGLDVYDPAVKTFLSCKNDPQNIESIINNKIWNVFEDNAGTKWISTSGGVSFYNASVAKFTTIKNIRQRTDSQGRISNDDGSVANHNVFSVYEDADGIVWCGILGSGLNLFDRREARFTNEKIVGSDPILHSADIFCITGDRKGTLWLGTSDGLIEYDKVSGKTSVYKNEEGNAASLSNNSIRSVVLDQSGILWIATQGGGLNKFDKGTGKFSAYKNNPGDAASISHNVIMYLMDDGNMMWIATYGGGLNVMDKTTGRFTVYKNDTHNPASISSNFVNCIYKDAKGVYWVGTYGSGLNRFYYATSTFKMFSEKEGLPNNIINGIEEDDKHTLWISTNNGMCRFSPEADQTYMLLNTRKYNQQDGMQSKFNENACAKGAGGWMYFGGSNGLNAFHPDNIKDNTVVPPVVITHFFLFEKPQRMDTLITTDKVLKLNYRQNFFSFDFAALNFLFPEKNRYAYMMESLDKEWIYIRDSRRYQSYTNLDPGEYVFRVKASNNDGYWNEEGVAIKIIISPPFWKTWWFMILSAVSITLLILLYIRFRTRTLIKQTVRLEENVQQRTHELSEKNSELTAAMRNLSSTQNQLIQSEKMASLGQLTAGIAHEIQNPLNFVNNFSELSIELAEDLETTPDPNEQKPVIGNLKLNLSKILHHGKRADSIVKGMLMHSRTGSIEKQATDINKLVEEFVDLAYHGMRAKDPGFNCTMERNLGEKIPSIKILPQDISRVLLNIFNNAFYAVDEKKKSSDKNYKPTVSVSTSFSSGKIFISIRDNGNGIPPEVKDKIFNPFFTTKPTGQGTGLGLSISYDIVAKGHGGELKVESKDGEFTEFTVVLPVN